MPPPPCTRKCCVGFQSPAPVPHPSEHPPHCLQKSLCPPVGRRLSCSQMAWSWAPVAGLELRRRHCVRGRRWGAVGGGLWGFWGGSYLLCGPLSSGPGSAAPVGGWKSASAWAGSWDRGSAPGTWCPRPPRGIQEERRQPGLMVRVSVRDIEKEGNGLNECTWADRGCFFPLDFQI